MFACVASSCSVSYADCPIIGLSEVVNIAFLCSLVLVTTVMGTDWNDEKFMASDSFFIVHCKDI